MNMTSIREKSKIFLWICLIGFILSLVGVMGTSGQGFLGGASLTSLFSDSVNPSLYVGKVGDKNISKRAFLTELQIQRNTQNQFQISTSEQYYIGRAWESIIQNTITNNKIEELNLKTQNEELKYYLLNSPPKALEDFLVQNNIFKSEEGTFDLELYQNAIKNNISWMPDSLINIFTNYEFRLRNEQIPRSKLQHLYSLLSIVPNNKVEEEYTNNNSNYNIDVLAIDYTKIDDEKVEVNEESITNYYNDNLEDKFTNSPTVTVDYILFENITNEDDSLEVILNEDQRQRADDFAFDAREDMLGFDAALENDSLKITGTLTLYEDFSNNSGLPINMGYNRSIVRFAFDNPISSVSDKVTTENGTAIFRIASKEDSYNQEIDEVKEEITNTLRKDLKKEYASNLINNNEWDKIQSILNPKPSDIIDNPFNNDVEKIKNFQEKNGLDADGQWGPASQKKYKETIIEEDIKNQIAIWNKNEESSLNGSFKTFGKNYKLMGCLSVMNAGDLSKIIESNNKLYIVKLNNITYSEDEIDNTKYKSIRNKLTETMSNLIFNSWIQYKRKNIDITDIRHKSI